MKFVIIIMSGIPKNGLQSQHLMANRGEKNGNTDRLDFL